MTDVNEDQLEASRQAMAGMRMVRFHKHQFNLWLNGEEHWLIKGKHYEAHEAEEDIVKKLRNAAWYRATTVEIQIYPDRMWVKATEPGQGTRPTAGYRTVESRLDALETKIKELEDKINGDCR